MPTTPFQVVSSSSLSSDFLASNQVLVDATSTTPVSVFRNPFKGGAIEALVITSALGTDSQLCYLSQDASVTTGWQLTGLTSQWGAITAAEIVAFATTWNTVEAFFIGLDGVLYHITMGPGGTTWDEPQAVDGAPSGMSHLSVSYQPGATTTSNTPALVAAITDDGSEIFNVSSSDGTWSGSTVILTSAPQTYDSIAVAAPSSSMSSFWKLWFLSVQDDSLDFTATMTSGVSVETEGVAEVDGGTILGMAIPNDEVAPVAIVGTSTGITWVTWTIANDGLEFTSYQGQVALPTAISNGTVVQFTNGLANVYLVDTNDQVWLVPVTGWTSQTSGGDMTYDTPVFGQPILLNTGIGVVFTDAMPADAPALIGVDPELGALHLNFQDPSTGYWRIGALTLPSTEQYTVPRWRTEITVYDADGQSVPNYALTVGADTAIDVAVAGQFAYVDASTTTTVTTNALGKATIATLATGLTTAQLTVTAADLPEAVTIAPHQGVSDYMAGTGTLPGLPALSADVLQQAQTPDGQPLAPKLQGSNPSLDPSKVARCLQKVAQAPGTNTNALLANTGGARYLVLTNFGTGGPACHEFATTEELEAHHARVRAALGASLWEDVWHWAGDVWEGIKSVAITVYDVAVDIKNHAVTLFVTIGEAAYELASWSVKTVEDALHGIESIFNWVGAEADKVIDWLKAVFDFTAIWNTKTALESGIAGFLTGMQNGVDAFSDYFAGTSNPIAQLKATLDDRFQQAEQKFSGTFSSLSGWQTPGQPPGQTPGGNGAPAAATYSNNVHANWFHDQLTTNAPATIDGTPGLSDQTTWNNLVTALGNVEDDVENAISAFADSFKALFTVSDLSTLGDILITDFLKAINALLDAFLDILDALVQAVLALAGAVTTALKDLLTAEISIGFLNTLYGWIAGWAGDDNPPPLTLAGLFSLVVAFPATVVFKLVVGVDQEPFPGGQLPASGGTTQASHGAASGVQGAPTTAWLAWSSELTGAIITAAGFIPAVLLDVDDNLSWASVWSTVGAIVSFVASHAPTLLPEAIDWAAALSEGGAELVAVIGTALIMGAVAFSGLLAAAFSWIRSDAAKDPLNIFFTIWGVVMLGYQIYSVVENWDDLDDEQIASDLMSPWGNIMSFCGLSWLKDSELYPVALVLKVAGDLVGSIGSGGVSVDDLVTHQPSPA